jgi:hypothetical protein
VKGLKGRTIVQVPAEQKAAAEDFALRCNDWRARQRHVCVRCFEEWWRPEPVASDLCPKCCSHSVQIRGYMVKANGEACPQILCLECGRRGDISRHDLEPVLDIVLRDNTADKWNADKTCEHCGARGCEYHHFAPRAIFNDADSWPTAWLCPNCHRLWHQSMRAAGGFSLPEDQRVGPRPSWWYRQDSA